MIKHAEIVLKSSLFIYLGFVFWRIKQDPNNVVEPTGLMIVTLCAFASGFLIWGVILLIAYIKIGIEKGIIEREVQKQIDMNFNPQIKNERKP